ncbi:MAG: 3-dehydroquinate synthase [Treponema sp.]|nr:3-dehydroquinate synthase [Treponema sp.]
MLNDSSRDYRFTFGSIPSRVHIDGAIPPLERLVPALDAPAGCVLLVCDPHTAPIARKIAGERGDVPAVCLEAGEEAKTWASAEAILRRAYAEGLGRDGVFIGVGGGVTGDLTAFAASVYMRGASLCLVPTTLLAMADAALGGKTGFDFMGVKNFAGTFYPASLVYAPLESLASLPEREWRSGMAELIKTAVLDEDGGMFDRAAALGAKLDGFSVLPYPAFGDELLAMLSRAVEIKGRVVEADPQETGGRRALLNLGHTFGHALETAAGLGRLSHGEAVAWGMVRACELGRALGITSPGRAEAVTELIRAYGYETRAPHPLGGDPALLWRALGGDKKKRGGKFIFIVPADCGAQSVPLDPADAGSAALIQAIISGAYTH